MKAFSPLAMVFFCLVFLVGTASANVLSAGCATVYKTGSTASVNVTFDKLPNGLSGYSINISVDDPHVATITALSYPSWATLSETPVLPSADCLVKAADLSEKVQSDATDVRLVTVTLQGLVGGSTAINLAVNKINDDDDARLEPAIVSGTFTVDVPPTAPVAAFTANVTSGYAPLTVAFTDQSSNAPTSWAWDFDDDRVTDTTARRPVFTYTTPGTYTVGLSVANSAGSDSEVKAGYIVVIEPLPEPPVANFAKNVSSGKAPLAVQFTDTSTGGAATSWAWDFENDGVIDSTEQTPVFVYTKAGTYSVNLSVANAGGSDSRLKRDSISVSLPDPPIAAYSATPTSGPAPLTVQFTDESTGSPTSWFWSFRDGGTSTEQNPSHTYTLVGTYTVKLTATNDGGSDSEEKTEYITVTNSSGLPVAAFTATPTTGTAPLAVRFTDQSTGSPTSWSWTFGDGNMSSEQNPSYTYSNAGTYTVTLTTTNATGSDSEEKVGYIIVSRPSMPPVAAFNATPRAGTVPLVVKFSDLSTNTPTSWLWSFGDGMTSTRQNPSHRYASPGIYTVKLTATNADGSDSEERAGYITISDTPDLPVAAFTATPTTGTAPLTVRFTDQSTGSPASWSWTFGDGNMSSEQSPSHTYSQAGTYTVKLAVTNAGGSDSEEKSGYITVTSAPEPPVASFTATPTTGISPLTVQFTDRSANTPTAWSWSFGDGGTSTGQDPSHTYTMAGTYTVTLTSTNAAGSGSEEKNGYIKVIDSSQTTVVVTPQARTIPLRSSGEYTLSVTNLPAGMAGYRLGISLSNASIGEITAFTLPAWATLNTSSPVPGDNIWFGALDLGRTIESNAADVTLGTVKVRGDATGNATLVVQVYEMDADGGGQITPVTLNGQLVVTASVIPFPDCRNPPLDPDSDSLYEDINGNGRLDFGDVVTLYQQMQWVRDTVAVGTDPYDFNGNGRLDFDDIVLLYYEVLA